MENFAYLRHDPLFDKRHGSKIWLKYCGFLDLSLADFMVIQSSLLLDQLALASRCELGRKIMKGQKPQTLEEFRDLVPLTCYQDYPELPEKAVHTLPARPEVWARTSGRGGVAKWAPYTQASLERLANDTLAAFILSSARTKGDVRLGTGARVVLNLPPVPYTMGIMAAVAGRRMDYQAMPSLDQADRMEFQERIEQGFRMSLHRGADYAASIAIVLFKIGESFSDLGNSSKSSLAGLHPLAVMRLLRAKLRSKLAGRPLLPRDIWKMKGLVCGGTDVSILRDQIEHYWGVRPLDVYVATEAGFVATQAWNKKWMTLVPYSNFFEFIPFEECKKAEEDPGYRLRTVLLDELEPGKVYEIVLTNFHGGPFLRYRIGDLVRVKALRDEETGINLPQIVFESRADDIIDLAGFPRLDEKMIWQAIQNTAVPYVDWTARKEAIDGRPWLHVYLEPQRNGFDHTELAKSIDAQLAACNQDYCDLAKLTGIGPIRVTLLNHGTMKRYTQMKQAEGFDIAHLKPAHVNPSDSTVEELLRISTNS
ncbi:MAG: GH3 auxin-responsive promoter family protein [Chloroflexi bacterium]|nr:GH3 auxin-responsive promoter family protein [Chloroflexota bacterium]